MDGGADQRERLDAGEEALDEALEILEDAGFEYGGGLANHGPMAAEALVRLGRAEAVVPWTTGYRTTLEPPPAPFDRVRLGAWEDALGDGRRMADWEQFFAARLAETPWQDVIGAWVPRLVPGLAAAAMHGVIRTGHAVRALEIHETPLRVSELARGLAYWAAQYQRLPGEPSGGAASRMPPHDAIRHINVLPEERRSPGMITAGLLALDRWPAFEEVADLADVGGELGPVVSELTATFTRAYLANADDLYRTIVFVHGVTGPAAVRALLPYLSADAARRAVTGAWQAGAAIYAAFGRVPDPGIVDPPDDDFETIVDRAVATGDEHAIKFVEACLREHALSPDPAYLAAARHAARAFEATR